MPLYILFHVRKQTQNRFLLKSDKIERLLIQRISNIVSGLNYYGSYNESIYLGFKSFSNSLS